MSITISAIIPTVATDPARLALLRRSLESALHQLRDGDELLIAADTTSDPLDAVRELCGRLGAEAAAGVAVRFVPHAGAAGHDYGHAQLNAAMATATGDYLTFNDDDDVYLAGAFDAMRATAEALPSPAPLLFRFLTHYGLVVWTRPGDVGQGTIGGHCIVTPNLTSKLGQWSPRYEGDYDFIAATLALWAASGVAPVFVDRLIARGRP